MTRIETPDRIADLDEVRAVIEEYLAYVHGVFVAAGGGGFDIPTLATNTTGNIGAYLPPRGRSWFARDDGGALVGMVFLKMIRSDTAEIKRLYVRPPERCLGLGTRLAQGAIEAARDLGATRMNLDTLADLADARALYERLGFDYVDPYPESEVDPQHWPWVVFMSRPL